MIYEYINNIQDRRTFMLEGGNILKMLTTYINLKIGD